jgi:hypothetical protein
MTHHEQIRKRGQRVDHWVAGGLAPQPSLLNPTLLVSPPAAGAHPTGMLHYPSPGMTFSE